MLESDTVIRELIWRLLNLRNIKIENEPWILCQIFSEDAAIFFHVFESITFLVYLGKFKRILQVLINVQPQLSYYFLLLFDNFNRPVELLLSEHVFLSDSGKLMEYAFGFL